MTDDLKDLLLAAVLEDRQTADHLDRVAEYSNSMIGREGSHAETYSALTPEERRAFVGARRMITGPEWD